MPSVVYKSPSNLRCLAQHSEPAPLLCISDSPPSVGLATLPSPPHQTDREISYLSATASSSAHLHHRPTPGAWLSTVSQHQHHELHSAASPLAMPCRLPSDPRQLARAALAMTPDQRHLPQSLCTALETSGYANMVHNVASEPTNFRATVNCPSRAGLTI